MFPSEREAYDVVSAVSIRVRTHLDQIRLVNPIRRVLITGSRDWLNRDLIAAALTEVVIAADFNNTGITPILVSGACPTGTDAHAETMWRKWGLPIERHPADWRQHGRAAGPLRNQQMVDTGAEVCLAFPLPGSRGTADCVRRATAAGIPVIDCANPH